MAEDMISVNSIAEIKEKIGEEAFGDVVAKALDENGVMFDAGGNGTISYYWDYHDTDSLEKAVAEFIANIDKKFEKPEELYNYIMDGLINKAYDEGWFYEAESASWQDIINDVGNILETEFSIDATDVEYISWYECFSEEVHVFFDEGIASQLPDCSLDVNILFGLKDEWNTEFTNISDMNDLLFSPATDRPEDIDESDKYIIENNAASWLVYSQGYGIEHTLGEPDSSRFLKSLNREFTGISSCSNQLALCAKIDVSAYCELVCNEGKNFVVDPKSYEWLGFFDPYQGAGSVLGIQLEKPLVISSDIIDTIQIEGVKNRDYTIEETYGMGMVGWNKCLSQTDEPALDNFVVDYAKLDAALSEIGKDGINKLTDVALDAVEEQSDEKSNVAKEETR